MADDKILPIRFNKFLGLNTIDNPVRLVVGKESVKLTQATNVDVNNDMSLSSRYGFRLVLSGKGKSIGPHGLHILNENLCQLVHYNDGSVISNILLPNVGNNPMSYADAFDSIYFTNNQVIGWVSNGIVYNIPFPTYESSGLPITYKLPVPFGNILEYAFGRLWIAKDNYIIHSDSGTGINRYDARNGIGITLGSNITLLKAVDTGLFVSDSSGVHYFNGRNPLKLDRKHLSDYPALPGQHWTQRNLTITFKGNTHTFSTAILFPTTQGLCVGGDNGAFHNLTEFEILMPSATSAASLWRRLNGIDQYICTMITSN